jgi:hypothetical protein
MPSTATGQKIGNLFVAIALCVAGLPLCAADVAGRRMVWAHYVPWYTPDNASQMSHRFHSYPQEDVGANPFREEIDRALAQGIDGFFHDMVAHKGGMTSYWNLRPFLRAAEGTPFQLGICLDAKTDVAHQVAELVKMLSAYGEHELPEGTPGYFTLGRLFANGYLKALLNDAK